jgi:hypothetical protein
LHEAQRNLHSKEAELQMKENTLNAQRFEVRRHPCRQFVRNDRAGELTAWNKLTAFCVAAPFAEGQPCNQGGFTAATNR